MGAEDGRPRYTEIDLMPPLNVAQGTPARFSLAITSAELMQPTTMRCRIEVVTSAEQHFSSPSFTLFFP